MSTHTTGEQGERKNSPNRVEFQDPNSNGGLVLNTNGDWNSPELCERRVSGSDGVMSSQVSD